jgi:hypothetical protein
MNKIPNHKQKSALAVAISAGIAGMTVADDAGAAAYTGTLTQILTYSNNSLSGSALNISSSAGLSWAYDDVTNLMTQTGGTINARATTAPTTTLFRQFIEGLVIGNGGAASATSYSCVEGNFGTNVGASICGNYSLGGDFTDNSTTTWGPGTAASRTIGGDDVALGAQQTIVGLNGMTGTLTGLTLVMTNATCSSVTCDGTTTFNSGYKYTYTLVAAAVADAVDDGPFDVLEATATPLLTIPGGAPIGANDTGFTDPVTVTISSQGTKGTATVTTPAGAAAGQSISYTSNVGQTGADSFVYSMTDGPNTNTATVTVNILAFGANNDSYATTRGVALTGLTPAVNDTGYTPDTVTVTPGVCSSGDGTITVTAGNGGPKSGVLVTYTPGSNPASGSATTLNDSCAYTIGNGTQPNDTANILVAVTNSVPVANDGNASAISTAGVAPAGLTATFTSPGAGGSLGNAGVTTAGTGTHGTTSVAGNVITYTITDASFFTGSDTFTYTVTDADGAASDETDTGTVTVTIANVAPTIADLAITTDVDTPSTGNGLTITAGNGSPTQHTLAVTTDGDNGSCTLSAANATGTLTYTPDAGYTGDDECVVTLTDGDGQTDTATIDVTVNAEDEITLPGGSSSMDLWSLSLLGSLPLLMRRRRRS